MNHWFRRLAEYLRWPNVIARTSHFCKLSVVPLFPNLSEHEVAVALRHWQCGEESGAGSSHSEEEIVVVRKMRQRLASRALRLGYGEEDLADDKKACAECGVGDCWSQVMDTLNIE